MRNYKALSIVILWGIVVLTTTIVHATSTYTAVTSAVNWN